MAVKRLINAEDHKEFRYKSMNLRPLFFLQEKLDEKISSKHEYDDFLKQDHSRKKVLSLRVEIGELLNELRLHKYWSKKKPSTKEKQLEEYADGLHFILSIGVDKGVKDYTYQGLYDEDLTAEDLVFIFDRLMTMSWGELRKEDYKLGLEMYLKLGLLLLFSWDEIKEAYVKKNMINQERQEKDY